MKKIIIRLMCTGMIFTGSLGIVQANAETGQGYMNSISNENSEEHFKITHNNDIIKSLTPGTQKGVAHPAGGGWHEYGVAIGWTFKFYQYSRYDHKKKTHRTTAMMNDDFTRSSWVKKGKRARANSKAFYSYSSNNSYWATR